MQITEKPNLSYIVTNPGIEYNDEVYYNTGYYGKPVKVFLDPDAAREYALSQTRMHIGPVSISQFYYQDDELPEDVQNYITYLGYESMFDTEVTWNEYFDYMLEAGYSISQVLQTLPLASEVSIITYG